MTIGDWFGVKKEPEETPEIAKQLQIVGDVGRVCLATENFRMYKAKYNALHAKVIDEMLIDAAGFSSSNDSDIAKFGARCLVRLTRLRDLRSLVDAVETDAKKGMTNENN